MKKFSTNQVYSIRNSNDIPPCKHFSIRGYVARMGQKDRKMCSPFLVNESDTQPSLPPLVVARFRSWSCNICGGENEFNVIDSNGIQETLMSNSILTRRDIDLTKLIDLTDKSDENDNDDNDSDHIPINNEKKNNEEVAINNISDNDPSVENNLNHQASNAQSLEVCLGPLQEMHTNEREPLTKDNVSEGDANNIVKNDVQDHYQKEFTGKTSKKRKKMRLLKDILKEDDEPNTEQFTKERSAPQNSSDKTGDSLTQTTILNTVVDDGGYKDLTKKCRRGRKRKLPLDENYKSSDIFFQRDENEVQNIDLDTAKTTDATKGKGKMIQENEDLDNGILHKDSFVLREGNDFSNIPIYIAISLAQPAPNGKGLGEGQHLSLNSSPQAKNQLTLPWLIQESTSNCQLIRQGGETNISFGEPRFPSRCAISGKGKRVLIEEIDEATSEDTSGKDIELGSMKSGIDLTADDEESDQNTLMEIAEVMTKSLHDVENVTRSQKNSSRNDKTMEVEERMPKSLPHVHNVNRSMKNTSQKDKHPAIEGVNGTTTRGENVFPINGISVKNISFDGNSFGMNNLHSTQPPSGFSLSPSSGVHISLMDSSQIGRAQTFMFDGKSSGINSLRSAQSPCGNRVLPSSGVHISSMDIGQFGGAQTSMFDEKSYGITNLYSTQPPFGFGLLPSSRVHISSMDTRQLGSTQTSTFNWGTREFGSSNTSLHVQGYGNATSNIDTPLSLNNAFRMPSLIVSHPPSNTKDMVSLSSGSLNKQAKERDFDLNITYSDNTDQTSSKTSMEYPFSGQNTGTEQYPNQRLSFDLNDNDTTLDLNLLNLDPAGKKTATSLTAGSSDQMLKRTLNPGERSNTNLDIGLSKKAFYPGACCTKLDIEKSKTYDTPKSQLSDSHNKKSYLSDKSHGPTIFGRKLIGPSDLGDRNMTVSENEKMNSYCSFMQSRKKLFGWLDLEEEEEGETPPQHCSPRETPPPLNDTSERRCEMNKNPAEFSPIQQGSPYMMDKEDKMEKRVRKKSHGSSSKQKSKS